MWTILKYNNKKLNFLKKDLEEKLGRNLILYQPKIEIKKFKKNLFIKSEMCLLGDYIFCYHEEFKNPNKIPQLKYCRGLKYFLDGFIISQKEIKNFISKCKEYENTEGFLSQNIFDIFANKKYKFFDGPFANQIFKIINLQKNKINVSIGSFKTNFEKKDYLFYPV